jgi:hypothetical protein
MTEQQERLVEPEEALQIANGPRLTPQAATPTPFLTTAAEVAFRTAAAVPLRPPAIGWRTYASRVAVIWRTIAASLTYELPQPRPHPKRLWYLEDSRLQREMDRL